MQVWLVIVAAALVTFAARVVPLLVPVRMPERGPVRQYLDSLPISIIAGLAGAAILAPEQRLAVGAELPAAAVVVALTLWRRNLLLGVLAGVLVTAGLRAVM